MTSRKKLLVSVAALFGLVFVALLVLPFLFKDRVVAGARAELDRTLTARVDWSGVGLTFFRNFPNLTLSIADLTAVGRSPFDGDTLASVRSLRLVLDVGSVLGAWRGRGPIVVRSIRVDRPTVHLTVLDDGSASWDVLSRPAEKANGAPGAGGHGSLNVQLQSLELTDGTLTLENRRSGLVTSVDGLHYTLSGNLSREHVVVETSAHAERASVRFAGIPYLDRVAVDFRADVDADLGAGHFTFEDNELRLNDLALRFSGDATRQNDGLALNVDFSAPQTDFGQALSLVPAIYASDFASLETSGTFSVEGGIHGIYGQHVVPAFALKAAVQNGMFRYPDLPLPARDIALDLSIDNPGGDVDSTVVRLDRFHVVIGDHPLDAALTMRTPVSDPDVDASIRGTLDLAEVARTIKLAHVQELAGVIDADASLSARLSDVDSARYERIGARGSVAARALTVRAAGLRQPISVREATLDLTPRRADLKSLDARLGSSDLQAHGWLDDLLGFALRRDPLHGSATFTSRRFVLDEWRSDDPTLQIIPVPTWLDLSLSGTIDTLMYGTLTMTDAHGGVDVKDQRLTMNDFGVKTLGGRMGFNGVYDTSEPTRPTFNVGLTIDSLDVAGAAAAFLTVRTLAPVARYARGTFSTKLDLGGALSRDMTPIFAALNGGGSLSTSRIVIQDFPLFEKLASTLTIPRLSNPTLNAIRSAIEIRDGRLYVRPFEAGLGEFRMSVEGSNGIDQSMDYTLGLTLPRAALGQAADRIVSGLAAEADKAGLDLAAADSIHLGVKVAGTVTSPSLDVGIGRAATSARKQVEQAAGAAVQERLGEGRQQIDSAGAEARRRAQARADSIVAAAEERAAQVRAEARKLADQVREEGNRRADEVLAKATNPIAKQAARPIADRIRKEADDKANDLVRQADQRADAIMAEARKTADELVGGGQGE